MKKKIIAIVASSLGVILASALLAAGLFFLIRNKNVEETGNVLGISWYNEEEKEIEIKTAEQLNEFAQLSKFYDFEGQTVKLTADIVMNEGNAADWAANAPKTRWMPIQQFKGIFDGQGHSISGLYGKGYGSPMALFAKTDKSATVKNLSLVNSYFQTGGSGGAASFAVDGEGKFLKLYSDAIIVNKGEYSAGIVVRVSMNAILEECWFDGSISQVGRYMGGVLAVANTGRVTIKHCLFSGSITTTQGLIYYASTDGVRTGGICGSVNANATLMVEDSLASGSIALDEKHTVYSGSVIGAIFNGGSANATDTYTTVRITGRDTIGSGSGRSESLPVYMKQEEMTGYKAYDWTTLDFDNYWAVVEDGTPILQEFAEEIPSLAGRERAYDISWYNPNVYEVTITHVKQLYGLAVLSKSKSFEGVVFRLGNDIVANEGKAETWMKDPSKAPTQSWMPIGTNTVHFKGTFDGQGHSISGLYYNAGGEAVTYVGLFGMTGIGSTVQNLKITNSYFDVSGNKDQRYVGAVAGTARGIVDTVYSDIMIKADGRDIGGIVGYLNYSGDLGFSKPYVSNCWFNGKLFGDTGRRMGGITGAVFGVADNIPTYTISNCLNTGTISNKRVPNSGDGLGGQYIGGILGQEANPCNIILKDCLMAGTIDTKFPTYAGSVMGRLNTKESILTYDNVYATSESFKQTTNAPNGTQNGAAIVLPEEMLTSVNGYQWTTLDFEKYWAVAKNDTPVLQSFADFAKVQTSSIAKVKRMVNTAWYKADAKVMTINTLEELYGFWLMSNSTTFEGQTIKLGKDIAVNKANASTVAAWKKGTSKAANPWFPIGSKTMQFKGSFDGQMHTISGIYLDTYLSKEYLGLFGYTGLGSTIKNLKITNSFYDVDGDTDVRYVGSFAGYNRGNLDTLYSDVQIVADGQDIGGIVGYISFHKAKEQYVLHNLWFNGSISGNQGRRMGGIVGVVYGNEEDTPTYKFDNCLNTGTISNTRVSGTSDGFGGQYIGGLLGKEANQTNIIFKDCMNAGTLDLTYHTYAGSLIGRPEHPNTIYTMDNVYMITDAFSAPYNDRNATIDGHIFQFSEKMLTGEGGYQWTALDFNKYWAAVKTDTPVLKSFLKDAGYASLDISKVTKMMDTKWYDANPKAEKFEIDTREELYGLWSLVARGNSFKGKEISLTADVAVNTVETFQDGTTTIDKWKEGTEATHPWFAIGSSGAPFEGTFNGKGHTISGICVNDSKAGGNQGIFAFLGKEGTIKNLKATDSLYQVTGDKTLQYIGGIVAYAQGSLIDLYSDVDIVTDGTRLGGIAGYLDYTGETNGREVKNCWFNGSISGSKARQSGGIVGVVLGHDTKDAVYNISNCLFTGYLGNDRVPQSGDGCGGQYIGGILGQDTNTAVINISDSVVAGTVYSKYPTYLASVVGRVCTAATEDKAATVLDVDNVYVTTETSTGATIGENLGVLEGTFRSVFKSTLYGFGAFMETTLDFDEEWSAVAGNMPIPQTLLTAGHTVVSLDTDWYFHPEEVKDENDKAIPAGTKKNPYKIGSIEALYGFAKLVNVDKIDTDGKYFALTADIEINDVADGTAATWQAASRTAVDRAVAEAGLDLSSTSNAQRALFKGTLEGAVDVAVNRWTPIGNLGSTVTFKGNFDGQGYQISGAYVVAPIVNGITNNGVGLFGSVQDATIKNLELYNSYVAAPLVHNVGAIAGNLRGETTIKKVFANDVYVDSWGQMIGGIVGTAEGVGSLISECWFDGAVYGFGNFGNGKGGILGNMDESCTIDNCLVTGSVGGYNMVGGVIGTLRNRDTQSTDATVGTLKHTLVMADVTTVKASDNGSGSVVGYAQSGATLHIEDVYTTDSMTGATFSPSGVTGVGRIHGSSNVYGLITEVQATNTNAANYIKGNAAYETMNLDFYSSTNTNGIWVISETNAPELKKFTSLQDAQIKKDGYTGANGPIAHTGWYNAKMYKNGTLQTSKPANGNFQIETVADMWGLAQVVNGGKNFSGWTVELMNSLDFNPGWVASTKVAPTNGYNWVPIGNYNGASFRGTFDGNGYTIRGIYETIDDSTFKNVEDGHGLFGRTMQGAKIQDLKLVNSWFDLDGSTDVQNNGSIAGNAYGTEFKNVYSEAIVDVVGNYGGGLVGSAGGYATYTQTKNTYTAAKFTNCWFNGKLNQIVGNGGNATSGTTYGGLVGRIHCRTNGTNTIGTYNGYGDEECKTIFENCLVTGDIVCDKYTGVTVGGFWGGNARNSQNQAQGVSVEISNSVMAGTITVTNSNGTYNGSVFGRMQAREASPSYIKMTNVYVSEDSYVCGMRNDREVHYTQDYYEVQSGTTWIGTEKKSKVLENGCDALYALQNTPWKKDENDNPVLKWAVE